MLWVAEGFTDYYADVLPRRAGLDSREEFLDDMFAPARETLIESTTRRASFGFDAYER